MAEAKSVVIKLTNEQREAIKRATGQDMAELKVEALAGRGAAAILEARKAPFEANVFEANVDRKAPFEIEAAEQRKAPSTIERMEERKAPFEANVDRKAPFEIEAAEQRKAPFTVDED